MDAFDADNTIIVLCKSPYFDTFVNQSRLTDNRSANAERNTPGNPRSAIMVSKMLSRGREMALCVQESQAVPWSRFTSLLKWQS